MRPLNRKALAFAIGLLCTGGGMALAQETPATAEKQSALALLDQATDLKIQANTPDELGKVVELAEKAIASGLDQDNSKLAKQLIASSAFQRAQVTVEQMLRSQTRNPATMTRLRSNILRDLKKAIEADPNMVDAYLLMARVEEPAKAKGSLNKAIELLKNDKEKLAQAYLLRGTMTEDSDERIADFQKALEVNPDSIEAQQAIITVQVGAEKFEEAYKEAKKLLTQDPKSLFAIKVSVAALKALDRLDEAIALITEKLEVVPDPLVLLSDRADLYLDKHAKKEEGDPKDKSTELLDKAIADLSKIVETDPRNGQALMNRCRAYLQKKEFDKAEQDIEDVLSIQPNQPGALYFRSLIAANQKRLGDAISDLQQVVRLIPDNAEFLLQLGSYYQMDDRPKKAIQVADQIIKSTDERWAEVKTRAYRLRGDAGLGVGEHREAIADFEDAIKLLGDEDKEEKSGLLNNLAWVLGTSPIDEIRNGKRAIELGMKACELTNFKASHILSTLAAGYAEDGQFEEAIKWSEKAVEEGRNEDSEQLRQLQEELDSYKLKKPWREKQETKEKKAPIPSASGVDT